MGSVPLSFSSPSPAKYGALRSHRWRTFRITCAADEACQGVAHGLLRQPATGGALHLPELTKSGGSRLSGITRARTANTCRWRLKREAAAQGKCPLTIDTTDGERHDLLEHLPEVHQNFTKLDQIQVLQGTLLTRV